LLLKLIDFRDIKLKTTLKEKLKTVNSSALTNFFPARMSSSFLASVFHTGSAPSLRLRGLAAKYCTLGDDVVVNKRHCGLKQLPQTGDPGRARNSWLMEKVRYIPRESL